MIKLYIELCDLIINEHNVKHPFITLEISSFNEYIKSAKDAGYTEQQIIDDLNEKIKAKRCLDE